MTIYNLTYANNWYSGEVGTKYFMFKSTPTEALLYNSITDYQNAASRIDVGVNFAISGAGENVYTIDASEAGLMVGYVVTIDPNGSYVTVNSTPVDNNINTEMGSTYYEEDLTTNIKKYFAEAFKFDGSQFEMDGDRIVGIKQSFIDSLATDLTNIVNTSITTATLTADVATINQTLTALGIDVTGLLRAKGLDVGSDGLTIEDGQGHKHKLHIGN